MLIIWNIKELKTLGSTIHTCKIITHCGNTWRTFQKNNWLNTTRIKITLRRDWN